MRWRVLAFAAILLLGALVIPMVDEAEAASIGTRQPVSLFLGGLGTNNTLSPVNQGLQNKVTSQDMFAARGGILRDQTATFGTWSSMPSLRSFTVSGPIEYRFWVAGNVVGTYIRFTLSVGEYSETYTSPNTMDLVDTPRLFSGNYTPEQVFRGTEGERISLTVSWGGSQTIYDSWLNNTAELYFGVTATDSSIRINV
ncbi:MAG: hypothetical protein QCI38_04475, partial [Candidatus Thermoplasmatota archaeon]|nr:hypothetical protein [Candidatus Thermoplasmatota archaeon]